MVRSGYRGAQAGGESRRVLTSGSTVKPLPCREELPRLERLDELLCFVQSLHALLRAAGLVAEGLCERVEPPLGLANAAYLFLVATVIRAENEDAVLFSLLASRPSSLTPVWAAQSPQIETRPLYSTDKAAAIATLPALADRKRLARVETNACLRK